MGKKHKSAVITLVERLSKAIITLKPKGRKASDIEAALHQWLSQCPKHLFKSITFDCGKAFSNWKSILNAHDIDIFFADPGCPGQRGLNAFIREFIAYLVISQQKHTFVLAGLLFLTLIAYLLTVFISSITISI